MQPNQEIVGANSKIQFKQAGMRGFMLLTYFLLKETT